MHADVINRWEIPNGTPVSVAQAFLFAIRNGGLALRRKDLGVMTKGAKADLVVWDSTSPSLLGWSDPIAATILHASTTGNIDHVFVNGEFVKRNKKLTLKSYERDMKTFLDATKGVQQRVRELLGAPQVGTWSGGFLYGEQYQIDVQRGEGTEYGPVYY